MVAKVLVQEIDGTPKQIVFANHAGDFAPTASNDLRDATAGNRTNVELALASLANGSYRQSAKADLEVNRAEEYAVRAALEHAATPTAGNRWDLYWAPAQSSTAANANPGGASGSDAAYTGYSSNADASVLQLQYIGSFITTAQATATIQVAYVGRFRPIERYGSLVIKNGSGAAHHTDDVEAHVVFDPIIPEIQ